MCNQLEVCFAHKHFKVNYECKVKRRRIPLATGFSKEKNIFLAILIRGTVNFSKKLQQDE